MKKQLLLLAMILLPLVASAHDIEVQNADGKTIYYNYINDGTELEVTYCSSSNEYNGAIVIPEEVTYMNRTRKVTSIGSDAFYCCWGLTSVTIPNSVTTIGNYAFQYCRGLTSIEIPNSVTSIGSEAFGYCSGLTSITIPNSVTSIGERAFEYCSGLISVTIGNSVTSIGNWAFDGCNLSEVISKIENPFSIDTSTFSDNTFYNATLYVPAGTIDKYKSTDGWKIFAIIKESDPSGIINIENEGVNELQRYTLDGRVAKRSHNGINIIQMNDGTTKKVLVK